MSNATERSVRTMEKGANVALNDLDAELEEITAVLEVGDTVDGDPVDMDVSILLLGNDGRVRSDEDFVFYNNPTALGGAVHLHEQIRTEDTRRNESPVTLRLDGVPDDVERIVLIASLDPALEMTCSNCNGMRLRMQRLSDGQQVLAYKVISEGTELALIFGEFYRRGGLWKFRAVGQGYAAGLVSIAREFGVNVEDEAVAADDGREQSDGPTKDPGVVAPASVVAGTRQPSRAAQTRVSVRRSKRPPRMPAVRSSEGRSTSGYQTARLFPIAGLGGAEERERRATSALLAVMSLVRPFGHKLLKPLGSPSGSIATYVEVPFELDGASYRPDGLIVVRRGERTWQCLVEVKTGTARLGRPQVEAYVEIARDHGFDAVLTIGNQISDVFGAHPVTIDRRKLKKVHLQHLSWDEIRTEAALLTSQGSVGDVTAQNVLDEFTRYIEYDHSGLCGFNDMGSHWVKVREAVRARTLTSGAQGTADVCERFDQLVRHIALHLTRLLGVEVASVVPRHTPDQASRRQQLADSGLLFGSLRVPGAADTIVLRADMRAERVKTSMRVMAPREGRQRTRVNWLLRQLPESGSGIRVQANASGGKMVAARTLKSALEEPDLLVPEKGVEIREFEISLDMPMGTKRGVGRGSMIGSAIEVVETFYAEVVQHARAA